MTTRPIIGLEDAFGERARGLRRLQRQLADLFEATGYEEVIPPLVERPSSLNSGAGRFLADQTLVFSDPADAGLLAIRPDMTPQIARIAASRLLSSRVLRLHYSGPVMLARPDTRGGSRQPWQAGIECLGVPGADGDAEVIGLAARAMQLAGFERPVIQIGHIGLLKALVAGFETPLDHWTELLGRRSPDDLKASLRKQGVDERLSRAVLDMAAGLADGQWIEANRNAFNDAFALAADELLSLVARLEGEVDGCVGIQADAGVVPRFLYHSGVIFAGFSEGVPQALLHGGRYDAMMAAHGRDMPATGFSCDLWSWLDAIRP